jgi:hypothetical protein
MDHSGAELVRSTVRSGSRILWTVALLFGCGCSSDDPSSLWVGVYDVEGNQSALCAGSSTATPLSGRVNLGFGTSSGVFQSSIDSCYLQWDANDTTATLQSGQSCSLSVEGTMTSVTFSSGKAALDGSTVTMLATGSASNGCAVSQQATLTFVPVRLCRRNVCGYVNVNPD